MILNTNKLGVLGTAQSAAFELLQQLLAPVRRCLLWSGLVRLNRAWHGAVRWHLQDELGHPSFSHRGMIPWVALDLEAPALSVLRKGAVSGIIRMPSRWLQAARSRRFSSLFNPFLPQPVSLDFFAPN